MVNMNSFRLLIVDDEDTPRLTLLQILQLEGYEVTAVESAAAALVELRRCKFDGMIVDIKMPGMSGLELVEKLSEQLPDMCVIVLTAHGTFDSAVQALRLRVVDYLQKPASPELILSSLKRNLGKTNGQNGNSKLAEVKAQYSSSFKKNAVSNTETTQFHFTNGIAIDCNRRRVSWNGDVVLLTPAESRLVEILLANYTLVVKHQDLVEKIYGYTASIDESARILRPIVSRLNKKLERGPGGKSWIKNVRGKGYLLEIH